MSAPVHCTGCGKEIDITNGLLETYRYDHHCTQCLETIASHCLSFDEYDSVIEAKVDILQPGMSIIWKLKMAVARKRNDVIRRWWKELDGEPKPPVFCIISYDPYRTMIGTVESMADIFPEPGWGLEVDLTSQNIEIQTFSLDNVIQLKLVTFFHFDYSRGGIVSPHHKDLLVPSLNEFDAFFLGTTGIDRLIVCNFDAEDKFPPPIFLESRLHKRLVERYGGPNVDLIKPRLYVGDKVV